MAERKHKHLLDVARTLSIHHNVPSSYWGDIVLIACYLINRIPSSVLYEQIPYQILYPDRDLFVVLPQVFDCVSFVHILGPGRDKLASCAVKCVFFGLQCYLEGLQML